MVFALTPFKKFLLIIFLIFLYILPIYINFELSNLNSPTMFEDEICSYNGAANPKLSNDSFINCTCQSEYANVEPPIRFINKVPVQCSYEKKRRFIALFLSIFLPFGVDHLYLGRYLGFVLIFLTCWITILGNCFRFAVSPHNNYFKNGVNLLFLIMAIIMIIWWIINIVFIWIGIFKDGNGIETVNDLSFLLNINN